MIKESYTCGGEEDEYSLEAVFDADDDIVESFIEKKVGKSPCKNQHYYAGDSASFSFVSVSFSLFIIEEKNDEDTHTPNAFSQHCRKIGA